MKKWLIILLILGSILFISSLVWAIIVVYGLYIDLGICPTLSEDAIQNEDISYCERYKGCGHHKGFCYFEVALNSKNMLLCEQFKEIGAEDISELCKVVTLENPMNCLELKQDYIYKCLNKLSDNISSFTTCENILPDLIEIGPLKNISVRSYCFQRLYFNFWTEKYPIDLNKISISDCNAIARTDKVNTTLDYCYNINAIKEKNISYCYEISDYNEISECLLEIALLKKDVAICDHIATFVDPTQIEWKLYENCYIPIANSTKDTSICNRISQNWIKERCVSEAS